VKITHPPVGWLYLVGQAFVIFGAFFANVFTGAHLEDVPVSGGGAIATAFPPGRDCKLDTVMKRCPLALEALKDIPYCKESALPYTAAKLPCDFLSQLTARATSDRVPDEARITTSRCSYTLESKVNFSDNSSKEEQIMEIMGDIPGDESGDCVYMANIDRYWLDFKHRASFIDRKKTHDFHFQDLDGYFIDVGGKTQRLENESAVMYSDMALPLKKDTTENRHPIALMSTLGVVVSERGMFRKSRHSSVSTRNLAELAELTLTTKQPRIDIKQWDTDKFIRSTFSDQIQLGALLKLGNISLDNGRNSEKNEFGPRYCGADIDVDIEYSNADSWIGLKVTPLWTNSVYYTYRVRGFSYITCPGTYVFDELPLTREKVGSQHTAHYSAFVTVRTKVVGTIHRWDWWRVALSLSMIYTAIKAYRAIFEFCLSKSTPWFDENKFELHDTERQ
jgi:hypothetical protein